MSACLQLRNGYFNEYFIDSAPIQLIYLVSQILFTNNKICIVIMSFGPKVHTNS